MGAIYNLNLGDDWPKDIWPQSVLVSKPGTGEQSKHYVEGKTAYIRISLSNNGLTGHGTCSNCKNTIESYQNYCCYCGAKIVGKQLIKDEGFTNGF